MYGVTREAIREAIRKQKTTWKTNEKKKNTQGLKFLRAYLPAYLHDEISSFRLFKEAKSGLQIIKNFSQRYRLHLLEVGLYEDAYFKILHVTLNFVKFSFNYQMYLLS